MKQEERQRNGYHAAADTNTFIMTSQSPAGSTNSLDQTNPFMCGPVTPNNHHRNHHSTPISSPATVNIYVYMYSLYMCTLVKTTRVCGTPHDDESFSFPCAERLRNF